MENENIVNNHVSEMDPMSEDWEKQMREPVPGVTHPVSIPEVSDQRFFPGFYGGFAGPPAFGPPPTPYAGGASPFVSGLAGGLLTGALLFPLLGGGHPHFGYAPGYPMFFW